MAQFPLQFNEKSHKVKRRGTRRRALHNPLPYGNGFRDSNVAVDDGLHDQAGTEKLLDLLTYQAVKTLPPVEHSCQHEDFQ
jgi:hypothetical protein